MNRLVGYARVSTTDQNPALQLDALARAGCCSVFTDEAGGSSTIRPQLKKALAALKPGDVLTVWKLDRLGRSLSHLIQLTNDLTSRGIGFRSLSEAIDTTSAQGKLLLHLLGALAEFERALITERTLAGLAAAKRRGVKVGRKPKLTGRRLDQARKMIAAGQPVAEVAHFAQVSRATLYRALAA